jgi:glycerol-3-phosphate acyltransferase PlsY
MLILVITLIICYLVGSISTAVWTGKWFFGLDVREHGSRNAGATNTLRVLGAKAGIPVLLIDALKGWLAVWLGRYLLGDSFFGDTYELVLIGCGLSAVLGHIFPVYTGFRGGKGVATLLGMGIALFPVPAMFVVVVFTVMMIAFRIVSLASITASIVFPFAVLFLPFSDRPGLPLVILSFFIALFIPLTHRQNIKRLLKGEEKKFTVARKRHSTE